MQHPDNNKIQQYLTTHPSVMPSQVADALGVSELAVVKALPEDEWHLIALTEMDGLFSTLPSWGNVTTIITVSGHIFEFKGPFPKGKYARGYYNLIPKNNGFHGHLKSDEISHIILISKAFRGRESYSINFFGLTEEIIFKVYLGRDANGVLFPDQVGHFKQLIQSNL
ncbi:heme utilization cystosolic carrier protein HutX [uncultured Shewanella sp.]|uniref:heme utilization cystosolic carrier protein HutX n=1 Tax=uncultured Shewanella sp. TaxID=173975 RepID=UPI0026310BA6|nr:heme utilization cystosolic carrier protein HutX [uncultured Shewanella sp.]